MSPGCLPAALRISLGCLPAPPSHFSVVLASCWAAPRIFWVACRLPSHFSGLLACLGVACWLPDCPFAFFWVACRLPLRMSLGCLVAPLHFSGLLAGYSIRMSLGCLPAPPSHFSGLLAGCPFAFVLIAGWPFRNSLGCTHHRSTTWCLGGRRRTSVGSPGASRPQAFHVMTDECRSGFVQNKRDDSRCCTARFSKCLQYARSIS